MTWPKMNEKFGPIQCQTNKESTIREKRKKRVFLCGRTVRVKVIGKVIPTSFLKTEGRVSGTSGPTSAERSTGSKINN